MIGRPTSRWHIERFPGFQALEYIKKFLCQIFEFNIPPYTFKQSKNQTIVTTCLFLSSPRRNHPPRRHAKLQKTVKLQHNPPPLPKAKNQKPNWQQRSCTKNEWRRNMRSVRAEHKGRYDLEIALRAGT